MQESLRNMSEHRKKQIDINIERANAIIDLYEERGWEMSEELFVFLNGLHKL